jgi:hypothetical protein
MTYQHVEWPSWRYGPNGEARIFESADDVPAGWTDSPGKPALVPTIISKKAMRALAKAAGDDTPEAQAPE